MIGNRSQAILIFLSIKMGIKLKLEVESQIWQWVTGIFHMGAC